MQLTGTGHRGDAHGAHTHTCETVKISYLVWNIVGGSGRWSEAQAGETGGL